MEGLEKVYLQKLPTLKYLVITDTSDLKGVFILRRSWLKEYDKNIFYWPTITNKNIEDYLMDDEKSDKTWKLYKIHTLYAEAGMFSFFYDIYN